MKKIVLISGPQGSGKTTLARSLAKHCKEKDIDHSFVKFAGPIYQMHADIRRYALYYGIPMPEKDGKLLQLLGTDWGRETYGQDVWVNACKHYVEKFDEKTVLLIDDCRFPNELAAFPKALKIRLHAPEEIRKARADSWREDTNHPSEIALIGYEEDFNFEFDTSKQSADEIALILTDWYRDWFHA